MLSPSLFSQNSQERVYAPVLYVFRIVAYREGIDT